MRLGTLALALVLSLVLWALLVFFVLWMLWLFA